MTLTETDIHFIKEKVHRLLGQKAWDVYRQFGSFLVFQFGDVIEISEDYESSEWQLDIHHCAWRLETSDEVLVASEDKHEHMDVAIKRMENVAIVSIEPTLPSLETHITFENDLMLRLFPIYTKKHEHWQLFTPNNHILIVGPGTRWVFRRSDIVYDD